MFFLLKTPDAEFVFDPVTAYISLQIIFYFDVWIDAAVLTSK